MRITDIHIKNYCAFYGEHHICLEKEIAKLTLAIAGKDKIIEELGNTLKAK